MANRTHFSAPVRSNNTTRQDTSIKHLGVLDDYGTLLPAAQVSAYRLGLAATPEDAASRRIFDPAARLNFSPLANLSFGAETKPHERAGVLVSSVSDSVPFPAALYASASRAGWSKQIIRTRYHGREKEVDTTVALALVEATVLSGLDPATTEISLVAGDRDYVPAVELLARYGYAIDVLGWRHATSRALIETAEAAGGRFLALDDYFDLITFRKVFH